MSGAEELYQSRYLSDSGRLFFNSGDALVPQDVNGTWDVYEYEPEGVGSCGPAAASGSVVYRPERETASGVVEPAGCVGLISSGRIGRTVGVHGCERKRRRCVLPDDESARTARYRHVPRRLRCACVLGVRAVPVVCGFARRRATRATRAGRRRRRSREVFGAPSSETFSGAGNIVSPDRLPSRRKPKLTPAQKRARGNAGLPRTYGSRPRRGARDACERLARKQYGVKRPRGARPSKGGRPMIAMSSGRSGSLVVAVLAVLALWLVFAASAAAAVAWWHLDASCGSGEPAAGRQRHDRRLGEQSGRCGSQRVESAREADRQAAGRSHSDIGVGEGRGVRHPRGGGMHSSRRLSSSNARSKANCRRTNGSKSKSR